MAQACYTPLFLPGAFNGVDFEGLEASSQHGRRGATGEFVFSERTADKDLGIRIRMYTIKARYAQNDHIARADALIAACETPGPGVLVHPTRGIVRARCIKLAVHDNLVDGYGVTDLDMEFVESNDAGLLGGFSFVDLGTDALLSMIGEELLGILAGDVPYYALAQHDAVLQWTSGAVLTAYIAATAGTSNARVAKIYGELADIAARPARLRTGALLWTAVRDGTLAVERIAPPGARKIEALRQLINDAGAAPRVTFASLTRPRETIVAAARLTAAIRYATAAIETTPATAHEALDQLDRVWTVLAEEADAARARCNHKLYVELMRYATNIRTEMISRVYTLPTAVCCDFGGGVWDVQAAYELHGDARRAGEILTRNGGAFPWALGPTVSSLRSAS